MSRSALLLFLVVPVLSCTAVPDAPPPVTEESVDLSTLPVSVREEAEILAMEDRRSIDPEVVAAWVEHPSPHHRRRIALALGRIGATSFDDLDGDGLRDENESPQGATHLGRLLRDSDPRVAETAAFALGQAGASGYATSLGDIALDANVHGAVRAAAIEALTRLSSDQGETFWAELMAPEQPEGIRIAALRYSFRLDEKILDVSRPYLLDREAEVRKAAAYALSRRADPQARGALHELLSDHDAETRAYAIRGLDRVGLVEDLPHFLSGLADPHPWVRTNSVRAITTLLNENPDLAEGSGSSDRAVKLLTASRDPDPGTKALAIETLSPFASHHPPVRARLEELLEAPEWWFREQAALALARAGLISPEALSTRGMRLTVARGVGPELDSSLRESLMEDDDPSVRAAAIGSIPDEEASTRHDYLTTLLEDSDPLIRSAALDRLAAAGVDETLVAKARELEKQWRADEQNDARLAAIGLIAAHDEEGKERFLHGLLEDPDPVVRRIAADAIENELGQERPQFTPLPVRFTEEDYLEIAEWSRQPHTATIRTVRGNIDVALLTRDAPITTWNFAELARSGYFDESSFMRVVPNFVIQGGDPRRDMTGGPGWAIRDEINQQHYTRGVMGMALSGPDTGGSQFFITHSPQYHLDGGYTIFGRVIDGMNGAVDQMHRDDTVITIDVDAVDDDPDEVEKSARAPLPLEIGTVSRQRLEESVPGYRSGAAGYEPDPDVLSMIASMISPEDSITVVLGTWCRDSQREVPRLFSIIESLREDYGVEIPVNYIAVDRPKLEPVSLVGDLGIESVATFIVYRDGAELGRIVETPRSLLEDDLLAILAGGYQQ